MIDPVRGLFGVGSAVYPDLISNAELSDLIRDDAHRRFIPIFI
jgi:hypothetical protein